VEQLHTPATQFPQDFKESTVGETASPTMRAVVAKLAQAFTTNDATAAAQLFSADAVFEDMTLHAQIIGQLAITGYLQRALPSLPYGSQSAIRHVVGSAIGGGYEWTSSLGAVPRGAIGLELNQEGHITRLTAAWDGSLLDDTAFTQQLSPTLEH
jgi:D-arabinose 1-dehydrogenase-like Zn-dependent alcohol dehydrogenase